MNYNRRNNPHKPTKTAHFYVFCGLRKLNTLNLRLFHTPLNSRNHFSTVLIKTNWYTTSCKYSDCSSLTSVTIGNSVTSIGNSAFFNCNSLKKITVNATTPPDCGDYIFDGVDYSSCVLVVPDESISAYKNKSPWNQFLNISEVESVINDNEVSVKVENGNIVVTGIADDVNMEVYNISGSRIYSGIVKSVQVPAAGLYLVKVLDKSYKIMVR